jgi:hypothetical protein
MAAKSFQENLSALGFPVLESENEASAANATLARVVRSKDTRLWEGFPVMLANSLKRRWFDYARVRNHLKSTDDRRAFDCLVNTALALYEVLRVKPEGAEQAHRDLKRDNLLFAKFLQALRDDRTLPAPCRAMAPERLKNNFLRYYGEAQPDVSELLSLKETSDLQYALSQVFSPKQKELVLKKFRGDALTKTEREYYSRTIRKKLAALANPELHRLAQKLL